MFLVLKVGQISDHCLMNINISNPCVAWCLAWIFVLLLTLIRLTSNIVDVNIGVFVLVFFNVVSAILVLIFFPSSGRFGTAAKNKIVCDLKKTIVLRKVLIVAWVVGSVVDILYSGGLPVFWSAFGSDKNYTDFGVPSFHGVINSFYLFVVTLFAIDVFVEKKKFPVFLIFMLLWPVAILGRGILLSALVQIFAVYVVFNSFPLRKIIFVLFIVVLNVIVFGVLGNYRGTDNPFQYLVDDGVATAVFDFLPNGFLWFYVYLTAGLNNVSYGLDSFQPLYYPYYSVINLIPSVFRVDIDGYVLNASLIPLADENLNTSTFYSGYISDFGLFGGVLAGFFLQLIAMYFYRHAKSGHLGAVLGYAVMFECIVFSVFYDLFFLLPYLLQIFMALSIIFVSTRKKYS
jgi:oligosaccharide repeat unit polymerase